MQKMQYMDEGLMSYMFTVDVPMVYVFLVLDTSADLVAGNFEKNGAAETLHSALSWSFWFSSIQFQYFSFDFSVHQQALKYLKIGTCPASQKLLAYMEKMLIYTGNHPKFHLPCSLRHS